MSGCRATRAPIVHLARCCVIFWAGCVHCAMYAINFFFDVNSHCIESENLDPER